MKNYLKNKRILIIGGTGFIGSRLCRACVDGGGKVTCFGINNDNPLNRVKGIKYREIDITNEDMVKNGLKKERFDYVFNLGGYIDHAPFFSGGQRVIEAHLSGLFNIVKYLNKGVLKGFVQVGTSDEYGLTMAPQKECAREMPISAYSFAKTAATHFMQFLFRTEKFPVTIVRFFLVYGPGQADDRFLPQIIKACLQDKKFRTSAGRQFRDFCYVDDAVDALILAAINRGSKGRVINVASGIPVMIREIVKIVIRKTNGGKPIWGAYPYRKLENMELFADIGIAKKILKWKPKICLEEGLSRTIEYYKSLLIDRVKV